MNIRSLRNSFDKINDEGLEIICRTLGKFEFLQELGLVIS